MDKAGEALNKTPSDLIRNIISSYTFIDFGIVTAFNNKKVDIDMVNQRSGFTIHLTGIELLSIGSAAASLNIEAVKGDLVLLISTRQYIASLADITAVQKKSSKLSYDLECLKAVQIAPTKASKVVINIDKNGRLDIDAVGGINLNGDNLTLTLFGALKSGLDDLLDALNNHIHTSSGSGGPTSAPTIPLTLDITGAETETLKTGG